MPERATRIILQNLAAFIDNEIARNLDHFEMRTIQKEKMMLFASTASLQKVAEEITRLLGK